MRHVEQFVPCRSAERVENGLWDLKGVGATKYFFPTLPVELEMKIYLSAVLGDSEIGHVDRSDLALTGPCGTRWVSEGSVMTSTRPSDTDLLPGLYQDVIEVAFPITEHGLHTLTYNYDGELMALTRFQVVASPGEIEAGAWE